MADPFVGELRLVAFNFAPPGWALCQGQLLPLQQNTALFSLLGTTYGGDGITTFKLPDLRGRAAIQAGAGPLGPTAMGEPGGGMGAQVQTVASFTLTADQLPPHTHSATFTGTGAGTGPQTVTLQVSNDAATSAAPLANGYPAALKVTGLGAAPQGYAEGATRGTTALNAGAAVVSGGGTGITGGSVSVGTTGQGKPVAAPLNFNVPPAMPPFLAMNYMIALVGIFPSRQ